MSRRILVVEDEPSIADNITYALTTEGFEPTWCQTGREALTRLEQDRFALVLLDVGLPDGSGFELAKTIRATHTVPIIFVTARSDEIDRVVGLEIGGDDYVTKPFSPRELTARVKAVLRRVAPETASAPARSRGPFRIDEERHAIHYQGARLDLSAHEFRILRILLRHPGRVYTRQNLLDLAWEEPGMSTERTVDAHIKNIRHKLKGVDPADDPIRTHRGVGYSLEEPGDPKS